jgi:hypothetical protein
MTLSAVTCPHCSAPNESGAAFCASCGKALPQSSAGPRVVTADNANSSAAAMKLVGDELQKKTKSAANTLLAVGILQWVVGGGIVMLQVSNAGGMRAVPTPALLGAILPVAIIGSAFIGLYFWARVAPLPATIVGMVIYCTLVVINMVAAGAAAAQNPGERRGGFGGLGIGCLDIVIIAMLVQGIQAALKRRKLLAAQAANLMP